MTAYIDRLIERLRPHAQDLVDAFGYRPEHLRAKIASGAEQERQDEARAYYAARRAAGTLPVPEKNNTKQHRLTTKSAHGGSAGPGGAVVRALSVNGGEGACRGSTAPAT